MRYDYIVVGGGSAGCVLAARLTADPAVRVLLIEAGGWDGNPLLRVPIGVGKVREHHLFDWGYQSEPEPELDNRRIETARGKVMGGSHSVNHMNFTRGHPQDYDRWAQAGAEGWAYPDVLPYFRRLERFEGGGSAWRGGDGPLSVIWTRYRDPALDAWRAAAEDAGFPATADYNGEVATGIGMAQVTVDRGRRHSAARAWLWPVRRRRNLTVVTRAHADRLVLRGNRAVGISYRRRGRSETAMAEREVILAGGVFNTPKLLMLSGIGPAGHLRNHGIEVVADLPVGDGLQDHLAIAMYWRRRGASPFQHLLRADRVALAMARGWLTGTGPATRQPMCWFGFVATDPAAARPDVELMFGGVAKSPAMWFPGLARPKEDTVSIRVALLHPGSRGEVRLRSADPDAPPLIRYRFLSDPADRERLVDAGEIAHDIAMRRPLDPHRGDPLTFAAAPSRADLAGHIRRTAHTVQHACGTCPIGGVVDPGLRVLGLEGLRVADASVMPEIPGAHINAATLMIAEKAAEMILRGS